jgi:hypothetical protein
MMDILKTLFFSYEAYYLIFFMGFILLLVGLYKMFNKFYKLAFEKINQNLNPADKFNSINKIKKLDNKCYMILHNTYKMIGSFVCVEKSEIFDEKYLLKLNEAKKIFYGVKRNKQLIKSNYLLLKIFNKIDLYGIDKSEIDSTIIYLILLVLNKK